MPGILRPVSLRCHAMTDSREEPPSWLRRATLEVALALLGVALAGWVAYRLRSLLFSLVIALFVSIALEPAVQFLVKRDWPRMRATIAVFFGSLLIVSIFVVSLVPLFVTQIATITSNVPDYLESLSGYVNDLGFVDIDLIDTQIQEQMDNASDLLARYGASVAGGVFAVGNTVFGALFTMVTIALFSFFAVAEGPQLRAAVLRFVPPSQQREILKIWDIAVTKTGGYIYSRLVLAVISAIITSVVLAILGVPFAIALGMWVGVLSQFVPVVGAYIAAVLPLIVALVNDPVDAIWVLLLLIGYQQIENLLIAPRITARAMAIHPAVAIGSVLAGAALFGGIGAILALPVSATIQAFVATAIERYDLVDSHLLPDPDYVPEVVEAAGEDGESV